MVIHALKSATKDIAYLDQPIVTQYIIQAEKSSLHQNKPPIELFKVARFSWHLNNPAVDIDGLGPARATCWIFLTWIKIVKWCTSRCEKRTSAGFRKQTCNASSFPPRFLPNAVDRSSNIDLVLATWAEPNRKMKKVRNPSSYILVLETKTNASKLAIP